MICSEVREVLPAFLDNELDAALSIELQRHLERCPDCAREVEIERMIVRRLAGKLETQGPEVPFDKPQLARRLARGPVPRNTKRRWSRPALLKAAVAAVILVGAALWATLNSRTSRPASPGFSQVLVTDFEHFLHEGQALGLSSSDRPAVMGWLRNRTGLNMSLPLAIDSKCRLLGARKCTIEGQTAAFVMYDMDGVLTSLVAVASGNFDLGGMSRVDRDERICWVDRLQGHAVVACRRGNLLYAAVSKLNEEELLHFILGVTNESH